MARKRNRNGHDAVAGVAQTNEFEREFQRLKADLHQQLVEQIDISKLPHMDEDQLRRVVQSLAKDASTNKAGILSQVDRERLSNELMDEVFGLGPLERLMADPHVTDILVNDSQTVYVERNGRLESTDVVFADDEHLMRVIQRIVAQVGRRIDEVNAMVDARLPDGSRVNAVVPPLALDGPSVSIRRFGARPLGIEDLIGNGSLTQDMQALLASAVQARVSMLISGGTGAGKTTLLNAVSAFVPSNERIVTIEDSAELILRNRHRVRMETRTSNTEGAGEVSQRDLVRNSLRMRPDRIIVGEVRGPEVWDMLQAMNTGHDGSLTTVHANSAFDALARLEMMVAMTGFDLPTRVVRQYIAAGVDLLVHVARLKGGVRRVTQILEIVEVKDGEYVIEPVMGFRQTGVDEEGDAIGEFFTTGYRPTFLERIHANAGELPPGLLDPKTEVAARKRAIETGAESVALG
ncbi:MAG: CpaF family protein [Pirellulales bacterium]|nr:CpaF family protein [Pirellulales bacterium]